MLYLGFSCGLGCYYVQQSVDSKQPWLDGSLMAELIKLHFAPFLIASPLFLTAPQQAFNFEPENQVLQVKQSLQEKEGIQVDQIRLIYSGKQLADANTLASYNIGAGGTIHMVLQLRGGN